MPFAGRVSLLVTAPATIRALAYSSRPLPPRETTVPNTPMRRIPIFLCGLLAAPLALAQEVNPAIGGDAPQRPQRVEINARTQTGTDLRRSAMVAKQTYGREELDKYGDTSMLDVLKRLPGVNVAGGAPRMRGLGAGYTQILINGDPAPPGFSLEQLNPAQVERIEVTKAPTAEHSAQAVAGTINIILKDPPRQSQRDLRIGMNYARERPTANANFTWGEKIGGLAATVPVSVFEWRGAADVENERHQAGSDGLEARGLQSGAQRFWGHGFNLSPRINWKRTDEESLSLNAFIHSVHWNNASDFRNTALLGQPRFDDGTEQHGTWQSQRVNATYINRFSDSQRIELKAGFQRARAVFDVSTYDAIGPHIRARGANEDVGWTQAGKYSQLMGEAHTLTAGWDLENRRREENRVVTDRGLPQLIDYEGQPFDARIVRSAIYAQDEWEISSNWSAYLGLRAEEIRTTSTGGDLEVENASRVVTPLLHLNYKFDAPPEAKGADMIRASLTRSYKAPETGSLLARPMLNGLYPSPTQTNTELSPDRMGNPTLEPELALGFDLAWEKYLEGGGLLSVGVFHRRIEDLIRNVVVLETVDYAQVPRWVSRPRNFSKASTSGVELEVKGRAGELLPAVFDPKQALNLRGALSYYRSRVDAVPGPDNRLDGQQPWSGNFGVDYRFSGLPVVTGASFVFTPGYATRQTLSQQIEQVRTRAFDAFVQIMFSKTTSLRIAANNLAPLDEVTATTLASGDDSRSLRRRPTFYSVGLDMKL